MEYKQKVVITSQSHLHFINQDSIIYCKSDNCYTEIHLDGGETLLTCKSLTKFSKELNLNSFIKVSQSYLINIKYIKSVNKRKKNIELLNKFEIPFTTSLKELLLFIANSSLLFIFFILFNVGDFDGFTLKV